MDLCERTLVPAIRAVIFDGRLVLMIDRRVAAAGVAVLLALGISVTLAANAAEPSMADHAG